MFCRTEVVFLLKLVLLTQLACSSADHSTQQQGTKASQPATATRFPDNRHCQQILWRDDNDNQYVYYFDENQRLVQCRALEQTNSYDTYAFDQQLSYSPDGRLKQVRDEEQSSQYQYRNGKLVAIDFMQEGQLIYRYMVSVNGRGQIIGLRGVPLNNSGLLAYSTRYQLDQQGRYVQLDLRDGRGVLYYRVKQSDFLPPAAHLNSLIRGVPYDLNRYPWLSWGEVFPLNPHQASHIETYRYANPRQPDQLIKRADLRVTFRTDRQGYITGQFSTDSMTTIRDTVVTDYQHCQSPN